MNDNSNVDDDGVLHVKWCDPKLMDFCSICNAIPCNASKHHFGVCPICHKTDGYLNNGNDHAFICKTHKTYWWIGANLFSSSMDETLEQQRTEQLELGFDSYEEVEPYKDQRAGKVDDHKSDEGIEALDSEDMSEGIKSVMFGDPKLMGPEDRSVEDYLNAHPYLEFQHVCRELRLPPAQALKRILRFAEDEEADGIEQEAAKLIDEGWEPGEHPAEPMTDKTAMFTVLDANFDIHFEVRSKWDRHDVAFRMGLSYDDTSRLLFDYLITRAMVSAANLSEFSHDEARRLLATCDYMQGMPAILAVDETKEDRFWPAAAEVDARSKPTTAERHEQAARAIEDMEG